MFLGPQFAALMMILTLCFSISISNLLSEFCISDVMIKKCTCNSAVEFSMLYENIKHFEVLNCDFSFCFSLLCFVT